MVHQTYDVFVESEHVILGNDALLKCKIPSYVTDFVSVLEWVDESEISLNALTRGKFQTDLTTFCHLRHLRNMGFVNTQA